MVARDEVVGEWWRLVYASGWGGPRGHAEEEIFIAEFDDPAIMKSICRAKTWQLGLQQLQLQNVVGGFVAKWKTF